MFHITELTNEYGIVRYKNITTMKLFRGNNIIDEYTLDKITEDGGLARSIIMDIFTRTLSTYGVNITDGVKATDIYYMVNKVEDVLFNKRILNNRLLDDDGGYTTNGEYIQILLKRELLNVTNTISKYYNNIAIESIYDMVDDLNTGGLDATAHYIIGVCNSDTVFIGEVDPC